MNVGIEAAQFLFWEHMFRIFFGIVSLQCMSTPWCLAILSVLNGRLLCVPALSKLGAGARPTSGQLFRLGARLTPLLVFSSSRFDLHAPHATLSPYL
jgi:hypothetical protein